MNQIARLPPAFEPPVPAPPRRRGGRSGVFGVIDLGSTKIVCLIARIEGDGAARVLGFGWQRAQGIKGGSIVDLEVAERAIRAAVGQAEVMADTQLRGAILNLSCGQPESRHQHIQWPIHGRAATEADLRAILQEGRRRCAEEGRETVHGFPLGFSVDATPGVEDPRGMICEQLTARLHMVDAAQASLRNLGACLARCDLEVEELVSAPFAAGLATLVEDEKQLGATVIDMGGGTTSMAVFAEGHLLHTAQLPIGGWHVTNDLARLLSTPLAHAERLKTLHGGVLGAPEDEREWLPVPMVGEAEDQIARVPRTMVVGIIRPRIEETFELIKDKLEAAGLGQEMGRRVVLTGGASQLVGVRELAARVLDRQVRLGRPHPVRGLPETASGPGFAAPLGLLAWAAGEGRPLLDLVPGPDQAPGLFRRLVNWLRDRA
ncbi:cell division protein FtsA [Siccirubricoccus sp. KC 17139]|uniref:Cell division protein FtsA n=1 Tax=Siccirubricoccus soli TaxID=2899147 RepID=A0ABT1DER3_9PROT|nr:cell division protein FtsA [Siccirubricoccus soli]MCO6419725.1 cell division protein FtsA [Siccirubricoccus soli]MCP2685860.1 cell division protein FtsA [Siccirubricoccus soli]